MAAERAALDDAAGSRGEDTSTWARGLLLGAAKRFSEKKGGRNQGARRGHDSETPADQARFDRPIVADDLTANLLHGRAAV